MQTFSGAFNPHFHNFVLIDSRMLVSEHYQTRELQPTLVKLHLLASVLESFHHICTE